jgi:L-ribulose-5-phosphate 3-epimerase
MARDKALELGRRRFLAAVAATAGSVLVPNKVVLATPAVNPAERIAATSVCFRRWFPQTWPIGGGSSRSKKLDLLGFPAFLANETGVTNVEVWAPHFASHELSYVASLRDAADRVGSRICNIQLDQLPYDLSEPDVWARAHAIEYVKGWIDRAAILGCTSVRPQTDNGTPGRVFDAKSIGFAFRELAEYGRDKGVAVLIENHGGFSQSIAQVMEIAQAADVENCKTLSDWGNSPAKDTAGRIADLRPLLPRLGLVSAKGRRFDTAYRHLDYDIGTLVDATERMGYRGLYSIELYVDGPDQPRDPVLAVRAMADAITAYLR